MSTNNSKPRELSEAELTEVFDVNCEKYLHKTVKINTLHALAKYLYWINNYWQEVVRHEWSGDLNAPKIQDFISHMVHYAERFIHIGFIDNFSNFSVIALHWAHNTNDYQQGDFSGLILKIKYGDSDDKDYFELSTASSYLKSFDKWNRRFHKIAQHVTTVSKTNQLSDVSRIDKYDLAYMFLPAEVATEIEDRILQIINKSDDLKCWIILQTGYTF